MAELLDSRLAVSGLEGMVRRFGWRVLDTRDGLARHAAPKNAGFTLTSAHLSRGFAFEPMIVVDPLKGP
ncbi:MAG: hypothetical protein WA746_28315 [Isosphaeraceae bacterium]